MCYFNEVSSMLEMLEAPPQQKLKGSSYFICLYSCATI